jgi:hypothetical protein
MAKEKQRSGAAGRWLRRQAIQVTSMLPEDPDEARAVLGLSRELIDGFVDERKEAQEAGIRLVKGVATLKPGT